MRAPFTQLYVHLIWSTWDRAPLITSDIKPDLYKVIAHKCIELKCDPIALGGIDNHLHVLVHLNPSISVADLVKEVKGSSSHLINHVLLPGSDFRWQGAYSAFSIRKSEVEAVKRYILNQVDHHSQGTVVPDFELPVEAISKGESQPFRG